MRLSRYAYIHLVAIIAKCNQWNSSKTYTYELSINISLQMMLSELSVS